MEELLNSDILEVIYNNSDTPTYLYCKGTCTNPSMTLATANIAKDVKREMILVQVIVLYSQLLLVKKCPQEHQK